MDGLESKNLKLNTVVLSNYLSLCICALMCVYWSKRREQRVDSGALLLFTLKESRQPGKPYPQSLYIQASSVSVINRDSVFKFFISHRQMLNTLFCILLTFTNLQEMLRFIAKKLNCNQIQFHQIFVFSLSNHSVEHCTWSVPLAITLIEIIIDLFVHPHTLRVFKLRTVHYIFPQKTDVGYIRRSRICSSYSTWGNTEIVRGKDKSKKLDFI